ncbi:MAG: hypothetical protein ACMXYE_01065 [Candidatus Woesearchaeota archaeon]
MLSEKRIREAETNVKRYLEEGLLKKEINETAKEMYLKNCDVSLQTAQKVFSLESETYKPYLWVIVSAYYSMFYIANAVLLAKGYKVGSKISHKVTADALIVFVRDILRKELFEEYETVKEDALAFMASKTDSLLESLDFEREKRSRFQYQTDEVLEKSKAITSLTRAKQFVFELRKLL